jgi:hypothetical protein
MSDAGELRSLGRPLRGLPLPRPDVDAVQQARLAGVYYPADLLPSSGSLWLTEGELRSMRGMAALSLPSTCSVRRYTAAANGRGGETKSWGGIVTYACRLTAKTRMERTAEGRLGAVVEYQLLLPFGATIGPKDRVTVAGVEYEVLPTIVPTSEAIFSELVVVRVN